MSLQFLKPVVTLIPQISRLYAKIDALQKENEQLRLMLKSVDQYYVGGEAIRLDSNKIEPLFLNSLVANQYEVEELALAKKLIQPNDIVLDLGCGLGISSIIAARATKTGRVVSYEADPKMAELAKHHVSLNKLNVTVNNKAIAKEAGLIDFYISENFQYNSKFESGGMRKVTVEAESFQRVVSEVSPNVITCDIEGVEVELFEEVSMPTVRAVIVEVHPAVIGKEGVDQCIEALRKAGLIYNPQLSFGVVKVFTRRAQ